MTAEPDDGLDLGDLPPIGLDDVQPTALELKIEKRHGVLAVLGLNMRNQLRFIDLSWQAITSHFEAGEQMLAYIPVMYPAFPKNPNFAIPYTVTHGAVTDRRVFFPQPKAEKGLAFSSLSATSDWEVTQRDANAKFSIPMLTLPVLPRDRGGFDVRFTSPAKRGVLTRWSFFAPQYCERYMERLGHVVDQLQLTKKSQ